MEGTKEGKMWLQYALVAADVLSTVARTPYVQSKVEELAGIDKESQNQTLDVIERHMPTQRREDA